MKRINIICSVQSKLKDVHKVEKKESVGSNHSEVFVVSGLFSYTKNTSESMTQTNMEPRGELGWFSKDERDQAEAVRCKASRRCTGERAQGVERDFAAC